VNSAQLKHAKRAVRKTVLARRDAMPPEQRAEASDAIAAHFLALDAVRRARTVMVFWSFGSEVATAPIIDALHGQDVTVVLPKILRGELQPRTWAPGEPLTTTPFGAREPTSGELVDPVSIDVIAVPAVVFDRMGRRVGYGGGYYDRFLPSTGPSCLRAGIGFALQLVDEDLPAGTFDMKVHLVVTDREVHRSLPLDP